MKLVGWVEMFTNLVNALCSVYSYQSVIKVDELKCLLINVFDFDFDFDFDFTML
jgi:hypothetical protein